MVGNLNELFLFRKADHGPRFADICAKKEGYGFNELEISNSTISAVFRQPLIMTIQNLTPTPAESDF